MSFTVVGTPGERRVESFRAACRQCGLGDPDVVGWPDVLLGAEPDFRPGTLVRIDSPGGDPAVDALLRGPGDPARVAGTGRWYATFTAALRRIRTGVERAGVRLLNDTEEIAVMFDKRRCHARLLDAGVPVPAALPAAQGYAELRARMAEAGWTRVFVKPAHGSSGSGVVALQTAPGRVKAAAPATWSAPGGELLNSLRVCTYDTEAEVAALIDSLAPDGLHIERWLPKMTMGGRALDLRVVVVAGEPTHVVVRTGSGPMTNLHLGGGRGDLGAVRRALGEPVWERALQMSAQAARCFPGSLMSGVDLLIGIDRRRLAVGEVNAFGDLLPGLTGLPGGRAEGLDTYTAQIMAALSTGISA